MSDPSSTTKSKSENPTPSLRSRASSVTLIPEDTAYNTATTITTPDPERYTYYVPTGLPPNPDAQPKPKSRLGRLIGKLQSPAVQRSDAAHERERLEEVRTGRKKRQVANLTGADVAAAYYCAGVGNGAL